MAPAPMRALSKAYWEMGTDGQSKFGNPRHRCGDEVDGDKYEGACTSEDCDYAYEADYEYLLEMRDN